MSSRHHSAKGVEQRQRILQVAFDRFCAQGQAGLSLRAIASDVGISLAGVTYYFPSKGHLLVDLLRERDADGELHMLTHETVDLGEFFAYALGVNAAHPARARLYVVLAAAAQDPEHPANAYFAERLAAYRAVARERIVKLQAAGSVGADRDPDELALELIAMTDGIQQQWLVDPSIDMPGLIRRAWQRLAGARTSDGLATRTLSPGGAAD